MVEAFVHSYQDGYPLLMPGPQARTDDQGEYKLFWLPPGEYFLATMWPRGRRTPSPMGKISSRATIPRTTDTLTAQPVVVRGGEERAGYDIEMQATSSFKISGTIVVGSRTPPTGPGPVGANVGSATATINILARPEHFGTALAPAPLARSNSPSPVTKSGARLSKYRASNAESPISLPGFANRIPMARSSITIGRTPVEIRDTNLTGVELRIYPSVRVLGKVTVDGHAPGPIPARVSLGPEGSEVKVPVYQGIGLRAVVADPKDGSFMVPAVTSGQFRVVTQGLPPEVYVADVLGRG